MMTTIIQYCTRIIISQQLSIIKAKVSTSESGEVSDEAAAVSTEDTVLDGASVDIVSSGITVSTGSVSEPVGKNVDVKV